MVQPSAGVTLPGLLLEQARIRPQATALRAKVLGIWQSTSWSEYAARVSRFAMGLRALGLQPGDRIAVVGDNRPEWVIAELGAQAVGVLPMGMYQDAVATELAHLLTASEARLVVAEDQEQVDKLLEIREQLPHLEYIVFYEPKGLSAYEAPGLLGFPEVEQKGNDHLVDDPEAFERAVAAIKPEDTALLCTTSGTTSRPKLAMLSHGNLLSMAEQLQRVDAMAVEDDFVSILPLAWVGEQMVAVSCALTVGFTVNFPEEAGTARQDLREIGPQVMFSPPRIWETLVSDVQVMTNDTTRLKRRVFDWAYRVGEASADARFEGRVPARALRLKRRLAEWCALHSIKDQLGLSRIRHAYTGGASLGPDVFRFYHALGINLKQIYGQTEVAGISVLHRDGDVSFQTVGKPLPETEIRLADDGEILARGPSVFQGYFRDPDATALTLEDGWLHSGDAGYLNEAGHLVVVDRLKDVMILSDGTTFSPQFIENKLKFSPYVGEAVVFGGETADVSGIIAIDFENVGQWAEKHEVTYTTFADLSQKDGVYALVRSHVESINLDIPLAARIRRFLLIHKELHADDAELTRTRKVRRGFVAERFRDLIAALNSTADAVTVEMEIQYQDGRSATVGHELRIESMPARAAAADEEG